MLDKVEQSSDWRSKYQASLEALEQRESEWQNIEGLLRKTIGRLSIAGRGLDTNLDQHLRLIQDLSREKRDEKLEQALEKLSLIISNLDDPQAAGKSRRSDPIMLMLELLQGIHFNADQRQHLKEICSGLLKSVASGHDRDIISRYVKELATLINENFDNLDTDSKAAAIMFRLIELLELEDTDRAVIQNRLEAVEEFQEKELQALAEVLNAQLNPDSAKKSIDEVMTTLLERLTIIQGVNGSTRAIQERVDKGVDDEQWADTLNDIVGSISESLKKLEDEKKELENFIVGVTDQLGQITEVISASHQDHQSDHDDTQSLHDFVRQGMNLIQKNFSTSNDLSQLKTDITSNIEAIRGGVDEFVNRINERHEATEERNQKLTEQLSQMEQETIELQTMLEENREKLLYDALTGVYSRMAYDDRIQQELARWNRYQTPFSYVIVDIDHFKRVNDEFGHNAGDKALKIIAQMLTNSVRQSDFVFRLGGEEFVLLLTNTDVEKANDMVDKLRSAVADSGFHFKGKRVTLTMSAGITETRENDDMESIYERADAALYKAKHSGRDCQFIAD
ncbi:MAG: diguanylate cyclase [Pseudomonadota bacterium]